MPGAKRPTLIGDAGRRLRERVARLGGEIRVARKRRGWTEGELADRAGLGRMVVSRLERGVGAVDLEVVERLGLALGIPVVVSLGRDPQAEVADAGHLAIQELVLRTAREQGFRVEVELPTRPAEPWRSIDVVLGDHARMSMVCVECWNTIGDIGAALRSSARKAAELESTAVGRWGDQAHVGLLWVVRATARNRDLVARYPEIFATRFPASSHAWLAALGRRGDLPEQPGLVWCDVGATRLTAWHRAGPGTDARRSPTNRPASGARRVANRSEPRGI